MNKILNKTSALFLISISALILVLVLINPDSSSVVFVFIPILLAWIAGVSGLKTMVSLSRYKNSKLGSVTIYIFVSFSLIILLLSGLGQLTLQDIVITVLLAGLVTFYIYRLYS